MLGVEPRALERSFANVRDVSPPKARDIIVFGLKCARDPQSLTDADFVSLREHGLGNAEIMEVISMAH